ncbi:MAG: hypothetical protein K8M05_29485 [Deltaproteobacteria bacterium]|nr:hypothetical protein [Kofleriaceae bacterium]
MPHSAPSAAILRIDIDARTRREVVLLALVARYDRVERGGDVPEEVGDRADCWYGDAIRPPIQWIRTDCVQGERPFIDD